MCEHLLNSDNQRQLRHYPLMGQLFPKPRVANDSRRSTDSQRLPFAGDEKDKPDLGILQDVAKSVGSTVARSFRNSERPIVENIDLPRFFGPRLT